MKLRQKHSNEAGFTLIEVLVAGVVTLFGILALASFSGSLVNQNAYSERETMAVSLAEEKMEDLRGSAFIAYLTAADNDTDTVTTSAGTFTRTWTIVEDFASTSDKVTVWVDWDGKGNTEVSLATLINN